MSYSRDNSVVLIQNKVTIHYICTTINFATVSSSSSKAYLLYSEYSGEVGCKWDLVGHGAYKDSCSHHIASEDKDKQ